MLAIMKVKGVKLPSRRIELYRDMTRTLLEKKYDNNNKKTAPISEKKVIQFLGPIAFNMQDTNNSFAHRRTVNNWLIEYIKSNKKKSDDVARNQTENFLSSIPYRGGLFVLRTDSHYGFMHRTFQEYFAARYALYKMVNEGENWIKKFVALARRKDVLWHEPFLLAIAYDTDENGPLASKILRSLLDAPTGSGNEDKEHDLFLAAECIIECKSIDDELEIDVTHRLLEIYQYAWLAKNINCCISIENIIYRYLTTLREEEEEEYAPILRTLLKVIGNAEQPTLQRSTLQLLIMVAQQLQSCADIIFARLIPLLLALAGLPAAGSLRPEPGILVASDPVVADLALSLLSFLGKQGPAGLLLKEIKHRLEHEPLLHQLVRSSLECNTIITLAVVPLEEKKYQLYEQTIDSWRELCRHNIVDAHKLYRLYRSLLDNADEACYPACTHILNMLEKAVNNPHTPWKQTWQEYLYDQLHSGSYIVYQEAALLWTVLFAEQESLKMLSDHITQHFTDGNIALKRNARRFLATLGNDLKYFSSLGLLRHKQEHDLKYLVDLAPPDLRFIDSRYLRDLRYLRYIGYLRDQSYLRDLRELEKLLLRDDVIQNTLQNLLTNSSTPPVDEYTQIDLLTILLGRVLLLREKTNEAEASSEREVIQIRDAVSKQAILPEEESKLLLQLEVEYDDKQTLSKLASVIERAILELRG